MCVFRREGRVKGARRAPITKHGNFTEITENEKFAQTTCVFEIYQLLFDSLESFKRHSGIFLAVAA